MAARMAPGAGHRAAPGLLETATRRQPAGTDSADRSALSAGRIPQRRPLQAKPAASAGRGVGTVQPRARGYPLYDAAGSLEDVAVSLHPPGRSLGRYTSRWP